MEVGMDEDMVAAGDIEIVGTAGMAEAGQGTELLDLVVEGLAAEDSSGEDTVECGIGAEAVVVEGTGKDIDNQEPEAEEGLADRTDLVTTSCCY
tara:strand:- start:790 stop:1071 length:282 start_codon:yes stop_codon:yes gene_type:complete